jgi:general secretion pathway protein A
MYERFYDLRERPFALSPDPDYLYPSRVHREALDYLRYGLESHAGFIVITGEIGSGKTTLLQTLLRGIDTETTVGRIVNTMLEPRELLETIMIDFGLDPGGRSKPLLLRDLAQYLVDQRLAGRLVLLVIDEAQNLTLAALEELRMLSNLETEKSKLLQIALVGQPNLRDKLASPELEQLRQRITVSYHLMPLDQDETANYINHRLRRAAVGAPMEFPRDVTDVIHGRSRGVPRIINVICDAALVFGYAEERRQVDLALMDDVMVELEATGVLPPTGTQTAPAEHAADVAPVPAFWKRNDFVAPRAESSPVAARVESPEVAAFADRMVRPTPVEAASVRPPVPVKEPTYGKTDVEITAPRRETPSAVTPGPAAPAHPVAPAHPLAPVAALAKAEASAPATHMPETFPTVPTARGAAALDTRAKALEQRERMIEQRERELAEQRRVLAEEYRLLRAQHAAASTAPPLAARETVRVAVPHPAPSVRFESMQQETSWTRFKRLLLGRAPAVEEN